MQAVTLSVIVELVALPARQASLTTVEGAAVEVGLVLVVAVTTTKTMAAVRVMVELAIATLSAHQ